MYEEALRMPLQAKIALASNFLNLMLNRQDKLAPVYIFWVMTYKCNCFCPHCAYLKKNTKNELQKKERIEIAKQIAKMPTYGITLTGGEPLILPEFIDIVKILKRKKKNKLINLCTNGVLLKKYADDLIESGIDSITISFDSHIPEIHDKIRNRKNTFNDALTGVKSILSKRSNNFPQIKIKGLISRDNIDDLDKHIEFFKKFSDQVSFQPIQNSYIHQVQYKNLLFKDTEEKKFRKKFGELIKKYKFMRDPYYRYMPDYIFNPMKFIDQKKFKCLFHSALVVFIDPYGNVRPCLGGESSGNIKEKSIVDIWKSKKNYDIQREMRKKKCICWTFDTFVNIEMNKIYNLIRR